MKKRQLLNNNRGNSVTQIIAIIPVMIIIMFIFIFLGNNTPGEMVKSYNTTCIINKIYEVSDDDSNNYYIQVTTNELSAKFDNKQLYDKYKGKEGTEIPAEITEYKTKDGTIVEKITKIL